MESTAWWEYAIEQAWGKSADWALSESDGIVVGVDYKVKIYGEPNWQKEYRSGREAKRVNIKVKLGSTHDKGNIAGT